MFVIALPLLISRLMGTASIDAGLETEIVYLPLIVLVILSLYQRRRAAPRPQNTP